MGAEVTRVDAAKGEEVAVGVERELGVHREIAAVVVGEERLAPFACPLHGTLEAPRRPGDQRELGIAAVAGPEISADVARRHAHGALRNAEGPRHPGLGAAETARARMDGVAAARRVPDADRRARLHRHAGDSLHPRVEPHHVGRARERDVHRRGIPGPRLHTHVRCGAVVEDGRAGSGGGEAGRHRGQRRPFDADALDAIARRGGRVGDYHRHHFAREAHAVGRHRRMGRDEGHVAAADHLLVRVSRHRAMGNRLHAIGGGVFAGEDRDHARSGERGFGVDASDARVGVRRPHEARVGLAGQVDVVAVAAVAHEEARVLLAQNRLAESFACGAGPRLEEGHSAMIRRSRPETPGCDRRDRCTVSGHARPAACSRCT